MTTVAKTPRPRPTVHGTAGFSLVELVVALAVLGLVLSMAAPRLKASNHQHVDWAADRLVQDLELARTRALGTRRRARVIFHADSARYTGYLDHDRDGAYDLNTEEIVALRGSGEVFFEREVEFGRGSAAPFPGDSTAVDPVTFAGDAVEFDGRGVTTPFGARGTIYLKHTRDPDAVAAITVTASASIESWLWRDGAWTR